MTKKISIEWSYDHWLNKKSRTVRTKKGIFIRKVDHCGNHARIGFIQMAIVKFDGNKKESRVPYNELVFL